MGIHTKRDFIKTATAVPMKPQPTSVDTSKGHKQLLENSGLLPKYIKKKVLFNNTTHKKKALTKDGKSPLQKSRIYSPFLLMN